jgi:hypothetical protein
MRASLVHAVVILALTSAANPKPGSVLVKQVAMPAQKIVPELYATNILRAAGAPGGIEQIRDSCEFEKEVQFPAQNGTVTALLETIDWGGLMHTLVEVDGTVTLKILSHRSEPSLLDVNIKNFSFDKYARRSVVTGRILSLPEVRKRASNMGLKEFDRGGFAGGKQKNSEIVSLHNLTLRELLNKMSKPSAHWLYRQGNCKGRSVFTLEWDTN